MSFRNALLAICLLGTSLVAGCGGDEKTSFTQANIKVTHDQGVQLVSSAEQGMRGARRGPIAARGTADEAPDRDCLRPAPDAGVRKHVPGEPPAGLDRDDGPDLVAGDIDADTMASVAAVLSRVAARAALAPARYDADSLHELAKTV